MLLTHIVLTPRGLSCYKCKKKFVTTKLWQTSILSHPMVMGGGAQTMYSQITFIFSKK